MNAPSRNQPCPCGSGKKFKHCCGARENAATVTPTNRSFRSHVEQGLQHHQTGNPSLALACYDRALAIQPHDPGLLGLKGMALYQLGNLDEARRLIERGKALTPNDARLRNYLAQVLDAQGEELAAELEFVAAVRLEPRYMEAWHNAGKALLKRGKANEALHAFRQALVLSPNDSAILVELVETCVLLRDHIQAETYLHRLLAADASCLPAKLWQCALLQDSGQAEASERRLAEVLAIEDQDGLYTALQKVGATLLRAGNLAAAEHWLTQALTLQPERPEAYGQLADVRKFSESDRGLVARMADLLPAAQGDVHRRLAFALGKAHSDLGDYDRSFGYYRAGNEGVRARVPFDAARYVEAMDQRIVQFSSEILSRLPSGSDSGVPIFIVGTPRSGTTLTESIIASHSSVAGAGEMDYWSRAMPHALRDFPHAFTADLARRIADEYLMFLRQHSASAAHITDKMPGNFLYLGMIHAIFPNAKIIHTRRHPIDACLSIYFQNFPDAHAYKWDLASLAVWYEQYQRLMAHWQEVLPPGTLYESHYERLVEDPEGESRKLLGFLGLDWEAGVLEFHQQERAVYTASLSQVRQPLYKTSKESWRRYEKHPGPLRDLLKYLPD
mgnify:FL=1